MNRRAHNRLARAHRWGIYAITAFLAATGAIWLGVSYLAAPPGELLPVPHPWGGSLLAVHGVAAYAALLVYALVGHTHLRAGWQRPVLRAAGGGLVAAILALALTGLALYYVPSEAAREAARWLHVAAGAAMPAALAWHIRNGRRIARAEASGAMRAGRAR